jgi:hypothetical protein
MVLANRIAGPSAGKKPSSKKKGSTRSKATGKARKEPARGAKRVGGASSRKGWSGPKATKQMRGSNTTAPSRRSTGTRKEDEAKKPQTRSRAQASQKGGKRTAPDKRAKAKRRTEEAQDGEEVSEELPRTYDITMDESLHGPEKMEAFKSKADSMVVGERTVIHHAARYGIVRGMTWTVILSALLFWLPLVGPAIAGYVGGRKAGGPLRGVIAVIIPALVMFVLVAAASESMDLMPASMTSGMSFDLESMADLPAQTIPLVAGLQQSIDAFAAAPPDVMFIMVVFAIVGGALSSLRRREEETVIEKVGIPLGELKERILKEQAEQDPTLFAEPPSRWHPHQAIKGSVAAHDAFNELVEEVAQKVYVYMQGAGDIPGNVGAKAASYRSRKRGGPAVHTGDPGPHYDDMVAVNEATQLAAAAAVATKGRSRRGTKAGTNTAPTTAEEAITGGAEDWEVVDTTKGRRPIRVVRSPPEAREAVMTEHVMSELEVRTAPPVVFEEEETVNTMDLPEPPMYVEERGRGIFGRHKHRAVYPTANPDPGLGAPVSPHGNQGFAEVEEAAPLGGHRNYERLPIVGSIYESMKREEPEDVAYTGSVRSMEEPTIHDTMEASTIASAAARELAEMARFEEGPDMEPEEDDLPPESRKGPSKKPSKGSSKRSPRKRAEVVEVVEEEEPGEELYPDPGPPEVPPAPKRSKPKARSTARQVKHPAGSLKSGGRKARAEVVYEEDEALVGVVEWDGSQEDHIEEEDLFNPRRLTDEGGDDGDGATEAEDGPEEGSEEWAEEERIAALVREREEWDRL